MAWGKGNTDTPLDNYNNVPIWDNIIGGAVSADTSAFISSDTFTGDTNTIDTKSKYDIVGGTRLIPSPYNGIGGFYSGYSREIDNGNALSDFNGKSNTELLYGLGSSYKAARACSLLSGTWYLPSCGEMAYILPRLSIIQTAINACGGVLLSTEKSYWTSTEGDDYGACCVKLFSGYICHLSKVTDLYVRPIMAIE